MEETQNRVTIESLVESHLDLLYRFAFRLTGRQADAEDLVQETFLLAHKNLHQLREPLAAKAWLCRILRRCWASAFRKPMEADTVSLNDVADIGADEDTPSEEFDIDRLVAVLDRMPDEYRLPLILFYFKELRYREIAEVLECPIGTVMSRLARGKAYLRARMVPEKCPQ